VVAVLFRKIRLISSFWYLEYGLIAAKVALIETVGICDFGGVHIKVGPRKDSEVGGH